MNEATKSALKQRIQTATRLEGFIRDLKETEKLLQERLSSGYSVTVSLLGQARDRKVLVASASGCDCFTIAEAVPVLKAMLSVVSKKLASLQGQYNNL